MKPRDTDGARRVDEVLSRARPPAAIDEQSALGVARLLAPSVHPGESARHRARLLMLAAFSGDDGPRDAAVADQAEPAMRRAAVDTGEIKICMADIEPISPERAAEAATRIQSAVAQHMIRHGRR